MPPQKRSKKNIPAETDQEEHHHVEGNGISFAPEPSNITDQERRAKLETLMKARAEKATHIQEQPTEQRTHQNDDDDDDDDETIDKGLERVQQKIQQLQKEKEKFASQLQAKRTWKTLSLTRTVDQEQEEDSHTGEGGEEEDLRDSRITTQETRTSIVSIMEENTAPKGALKRRRTSQEFSKRKL
jgi:hypothetical protein